MLTLTRQSVASVPVVLGEALAGSEALRAAERGSEAASRAVAAWRGRTWTQTDRLALAELRDRYPEVDMAELLQVAPLAVVVMTEHAGRGGQVAAVAALLRRCGLSEGSPRVRRQAAVGLVEAVTSPRVLLAGRWCR